MRRPYAVSVRGWWCTRVRAQTDLTETIAWVSEHFYNNSGSGSGSSASGPKLATPAQPIAEPRVFIKEKRRGLRLNRTTDGVGHPAGDDDGELRCDVGAWYNAMSPAKLES
jgi:hypothetical protein